MGVFTRGSRILELRLFRWRKVLVASELLRMFGIVGFLVPSFRQIG